MVAAAGTSEYRPSAAELSELTEFTFQSGFNPAAQFAMEFLKSIEDKYLDGKMRMHINDISHAELRSLREMIREFVTEALNFKYAMFTIERLADFKLTASEAKKTYQWIGRLESKNEEIRKIISSAQSKLGCNRVSMKSLYKNLRE
jgi:hypothetical protein